MSFYDKNIPSLISDRILSTGSLVGIIITLGAIISMMREGNTQVISIISPFLGVILTLLTSFFFSFFLAKGNFDRALEEKMNTNTYILVSHLRFTFDILNNPQNSIEFKDMLLDKDWFIRLAESNLNSSERKTLKEWFAKIKVLSIGSGPVECVHSQLHAPVTVTRMIDSTLLSTEIVRKCFSHFYSDVQAILDKYEKK